MNLNAESLGENSDDESKEGVDSEKEGTHPTNKKKKKKFRYLRKSE